MDAITPRQTKVLHFVAQHGPQFRFRGIKGFDLRAVDALMKRGLLRVTDEAYPHTNAFGTRQLRKIELAPAGREILEKDSSPEVLGR